MQRSRSPLPPARHQLCPLPRRRRSLPRSRAPTTRRHPSRLPPRRADPVSGAEDDVKMPLLEHLTELRTRLLYSLVGFFLAFIFCFSFWKPVLDILTAPLEAACLAQGKACPVIFTNLTEPFFTQ